MLNTFRLQVSIYVEYR